jgi:hypothetical protein
MVAWLDKLKTALLWGEVGLYCFCCLIIHFVDSWGIPFAHKVFEVFGVCIQNVLQIQSRYRCGKDGIGFVMIHNKKTDIAIQGHEGKDTGAVVTHNAGILVGKCSNTENVGD